MNDVMLPLTQHAKNKIAIYGISEQDIATGLSKAFLDCEDVIEKSGIKGFIIRLLPFIAVISIETNKIITVYRTDSTTINNNRRSGRWDCQ